MFYFSPQLNRVNADHRGWELLVRRQKTIENILVINELGEMNWCGWGENMYDVWIRVKAAGIARVMGNAYLNLANRNRDHFYLLSPFELIIIIVYCANLPLKTIFNTSWKNKPPERFKISVPSPFSGKSRRMYVKK